MNNTCRVTAETNQFYSEQEFLEKAAERQADSRQESIESAVDDIIGTENSDMVIEAITEDDKCEKAIFELATINTRGHETLSTLTDGQVRQLANAALAINQRIEIYVTKCVQVNNLDRGNS